MKNKRLSFQTAIALFVLFAVLFPVGTGHCTASLDKMVRKHTLGNGLTLLIVERPLSPTISFQITHRVGATDDPAGKTGLAHFLEHMLFKGTRTIGSRDFDGESPALERMYSAGMMLDTERRKGAGADQATLQRLSRSLEDAQREANAFAIKSEIDRLYKENGADGGNAGTGMDLTSYYVSLPANKLELWARIESDRMSDPVFREFYSERDVIREERRQSVESNPARLLMEAFLKAAFPVHPYGRPVIGLQDDMAFLDPASLKHFFQTRYAPNNTVIAVVGAVSTPAVIQLVEKYFGAIPPVQQPQSLASAEPLQTAERRVSVFLDANPQIMIGYHKPNLPDRDDAVFDVIETLLSQGRTARLQQALVEGKKLLQRIDTVNGLPGNRYPNLFAVLASPRKPHSLEETETAIDQELDRLRQSPVSVADLDKVKNQMRMAFLLNLDTNEGIARCISMGEALAGDFRLAEERLQLAESVTADDILRVSRTYLIKSNRTVAVLNRLQNQGGRP